jgi:short-subunit dehydrogenase
MSPLALVTGASEGIGRELAKCFAADRLDLILTARDEARLNELAAELRTAHSVAVTVIPMDLSAPGAAEALHQAVTAKGFEVEYLVNNAGFGNYGLFLENDPAAEQRLIDVNISALMQLTRRFTPAMVSRGHGKILNVASIAAYTPGPLLTVYYASKAFVLSFSEALDCELAGTGVSVTALCPGPTTSQFGRRAGLSGSHMGSRSPLHETSAAVARAGYCGMMKGKRVVYPGVRHFLMAWITRLSPRRINTVMVRRMQERRK